MRSSPLSSKLKTFSKIYKTLGIKGVSSIIVGKIFPANNPYFAWESRYLFKYSIQKKITTLDSNNNFSVRKLSNIETFKLVNINGMTQMSIQNSLNDNQNCWAVFSENNIAGYVWISDLISVIHSDTGYLFPLKQHKKAYWWRDVYILPEYRGNRLVQILHNSWLNSLANTIEETLFTEISPKNIASLKVHTNIGFINFCHLKMWCILGLRIYWLRYNSKSSVSFRYSLRWLY